MESVSEALVLVEQLSHRPDSHFAAMLAGGMQFLGWSEDRQLFADIRDVLLMIMASFGGKKLTRDDLWTRPVKEEETRPEQAATIAEFDTGAFMRWLMT